MRQFNDIDLRAVQSKQLTILKELDRICKKNDISYYLIGGSALGAVRHKGFIPWDEDIDIGMKRNDYIKFMQIASKEIKSGFFLQSMSTDSKYPLLYAKIRLDGTSLIEEEMRTLEDKIHQGIFIDIFPLDYVSDSIILSRLHFKFMHFFISIASSQINSYPKSKIKRLIKKIYSKTFLKIFGLPKLEKISSKVASIHKDKPKKKITNFYGRHREKETVPIDYFKDPTFLIFEDMLVPLPSQPDKYLECLYGNYMQFPPEEKRSVHNVYFLSSNISYQDFFSKQKS